MLGVASRRKLWSMGGVVKSIVGCLILAACLTATGFTRVAKAAELPVETNADSGTMTALGRAALSRASSLEKDVAKSNSSGLSLEGAYAWQVASGSVRLKADRIYNRNSGGTSGTIRLELWAFPSPYSGSSQSGYKIGQAQFDPLKAGYYYYGIDMTVAQMASPPSGTWYMSLLVTEYLGSGGNDGFVTRDYGNFSQPWVIGGPPTGGNLAIEGAVAYSISGGQVRLQAEAVANNRSATSGTLRLELWASAAPYSGTGGVSGYKVAQVQMNPLAAGYHYSNIDATVGQLTTPPQGTWYTALMLTEYTGDAQNNGFVIVDHVNFSSPWVIGNPPGNSGTVTVYEFYNSGLKHYFRTADAAEAAAIDGGAAGPGWSRTNDDFKAYAAASGAPGSDICRFYTKGANSHFYTGSTSECAGLKNPNSGWIYEGLSFRIKIPTGAGCGAAELPIYRLYNNRYMFNDSNHRFTSQAYLASQMVAQGWVAEGVAFCAPAN